MPTTSRPNDALGRAALTGAALALLACSTPPAPLSVPPPTAAPVAPASAAPVAGPTASASPTATPAGSVAAPAPAAKGPYNVLVVSVDAMRADMPWAGYPRDIAPNLQRLEKESVSYTRAYSVSSYTAMSFGGFLSGRYPSEIRRSGSFFSAYPDDVVMFPELLQAAGVHTLSAQAHFYFDQKAGFHQGFDVFRMVPGLKADNKTDDNVTSPEHLALALEILGTPANTAGRFFAWFHFMDPHDKYVTHEGLDFGKRSRDRYDSEIAFVDRHIAKLLEFVRSQPWGARTAVIVTADHGEAFGEHDRHRHGFEIWEPLVRVPLIVNIPGVAPRRIDVPRSAIDLPRTILELLDVPPDPTFQGRSLLAEMRGDEAPEPRDVVIDLPRTTDNDRRRALIHDHYKIVSYGSDYRYELYDLEKDPEERRNLAKADKKLYEDMRRRYDAAKETIRDICPDRRDWLMSVPKGKDC
ncbi:MAG: sulfatase-like hydrolase/transferase [Myxococcales bacterium]|nr:sulfatase-like hydrolase/transferase [Myxococcales bacterium]